jgi:hypothetical protein
VIAKLTQEKQDLLDQLHKVQDEFDLAKHRTEELEMEIEW